MGYERRSTDLRLERLHPDLPKVRHVKRFEYWVVYKRLSTRFLGLEDGLATARQEAHFDAQKG